MDDRRKEIRKKVLTFTPVYAAASHKVLGYLYNLTSQGAMVIGHTPAELDSLETLLFEFPDEFGIIAATRMAVKARVARCTVDEDDPRSYLLGFEFTEISAEQEAVIQSLLERYHFRHQPRREA